MINVVKPVLMDLSMAPLAVLRRRSRHRSPYCGTMFHRHFIVFQSLRPQECQNPFCHAQKIAGRTYLAASMVGLPNWGALQICLLPPPNDFPWHGWL
jgi:hypothetical protein